MPKASEFAKKYWIPIALILMAVTSKFIGFLRNAFIAYYFGTGYDADLLQILLFPTDFVTAYIMNQTIITSLTIYFSRKSNSQSNNESNALLNKRTNKLLNYSTNKLNNYRTNKLNNQVDIFTRIFHFYRVLLIITSVGLAALMIVSYPEVPVLYSILAALPGIFYGMSGIIQGYLNYNKKFLWSGAQELVAHFVLLMGVIIAFKLGVVWYVGVMIFTGVVRVLIQVPDLIKHLNGRSWVKELFGYQKVMFEGDLLLYVGPVIFTFVLSGVPSYYVLKYLESAGEGYIAAYNYAAKIVGLFNSIVVIPITTYLIPHMQGWIKEGKIKLVHKANMLALLGIGGLSIFAAVMSVLFPELWVTIIYARGEFDSSSIWLTAQFLKYYAFAMVGYALMYYLLQLSLLRNRAGQLMLSFIVGTILILVLMATLPFAPYTTVGLAFTIGVMGSVIVLVW